MIYEKSKANAYPHNDLLALLTSACASSPQDLILGKWEADAAMKITAEFHRDGKAALTMFGQTVHGAYKISENELEWTLNGITTKSKSTSPRPNSN